jgi:Secretion system C-terminal sorting domain/FG-GAP-like repeat/IPT/TIG domain
LKKISMSVQQNYTLLALLFIAISINCIAQPVISSFSPASGAIGSAVTISGSGFSAIPTNNIVYFGGVRAVVSTSSAGVLSVVVPNGATYQPITITVNNLTAYSRLPFVVTFNSTSTDFTSTTFSERYNLPITNGGSQGCALADINTDGKLDITTSFETNVGVAKNTSSLAAIAFDPKIDLPAGNFPYGNATADFDGDGLLDIAAAKASASSFEFIFKELSVFRNTSAGNAVSFAARLDLGANEGEKSWYWIAVNDLDLDGKPDIVISNNSAAGKIAIFRNTSTPGSISFADPVKYATGSSPRVVTTGDIDNDGKVEILTANQGGRNISLFRNQCTPGNILFAAPLSFATRSSTLFPEDVSLADLNLDGKADIIVTDHFHPNPGTVSVFKNNSTPGNISLATRVDYITPADPWSISCNDFNGDGKPDLAVSNYFSNSVTLYKNTGTAGGEISLTEQVTYTGFLTPRDVISGDINGDTKPEIVVRNYSGNSYSILTNGFALQPIPLTLLSFRGIRVQNGYQLNWTTANERNVSHFVIEHGIDGIRFSAVGQVAAANRGNNEQQYSFVYLAASAGTHFYRLKMTDADGRFTFSPIISTNDIKRENTIISPNPVKDIVNIQLSSSQKTEIKITDAAGRMVISTERMGVTNTTINVSSLRPGNYWISLIAGKSVTHTMMIKQ